MTNGQDIAEALAGVLSAIPGVRVWAYAPDTFLPPGIVIQQPTLSWETDQRTFCAIQWTFPMVVAVARNNEQEAQAALFRILEAMSDVLAESADLGGLAQTIRLLNASPTTITSNGMDYPAYLCAAEIIA